MHEIRLSALEETGQLVKQVSVDMLVAVVIGEAEEIIAFHKHLLLTFNTISQFLLKPSLSEMFCLYI